MRSVVDGPIVGESRVKRTGTNCEQVTGVSEVNAKLRFARANRKRGDVTGQLLLSCTVCTTRTQRTGTRQRSIDDRLSTVRSDKSTARSAKSARFGKTGQRLAISETKVFASFGGTARISARTSVHVSVLGLEGRGMQARNPSRNFDETIVATDAPD